MKENGRLLVGIEKLNKAIFFYWKSCRASYLQGQDLGKAVNGNDIASLDEMNPEALEKWKIGDRNVLYVLKLSILKELVEHIKEVITA